LGAAPFDGIPVRGVGAVGVCGAAAGGGVVGGAAGGAGVVAAGGGVVAAGGADLVPLDGVTGAGAPLS
jgi:hypothetical protein